MRMYSCGCPAILQDGSTDFGPKLIRELGVWDFPFVSYVRDNNEFPHYQHAKQFDYWARILSMKCDCLARTWNKFKDDLPDMPITTSSMPRSRDFHFFNCIQYRPELRDTYRMHMKTSAFVDCRGLLPLPTDMMNRYRA